jgi:hypothetical protein
MWGMRLDAQIVFGSNWVRTASCHRRSGYAGLAFGVDASDQIYQGCATLALAPANSQTGRSLSSGRSTPRCGRTSRRYSSQRVFRQSTTLLMSQQFRVLCRNASGNAVDRLWIARHIKPSGSGFVLSRDSLAAPLAPARCDKSAAQAVTHWAADAYSEFCSALIH